ncbi:hypothetical protein HHI36_003385 [Cryptolaemus montrouzieri]|uniref:Uncharacterized protein n=1 Tax=Cryptolaemus montrouzieri TaxID=559131 RepID=A0ABD2PDS8_9CUCU
MPNLSRQRSNYAGGHPSRKKKRQFSENRFTAECDTEQVSTSAKKLKESDYGSVPVDASSNYVLLHFLHVSSMLSTFVKCQSCDGELKFLKTNGAGVAFKIVASCSCSTRYCESSPRKDNMHTASHAVSNIFKPKQ